MSSGIVCLIAIIFSNCFSPQCLCQNYHPIKTSGGPESSLKILEYSYLPCHRHRPSSWRAIIITETNLSRVSRRVQSLASDQCLPNNVPVTADTKAAEFTILVIFHYVIPLHLACMTMLFAEVNERIVTGAGFSGVTGASQDILRHFSRDLGNSSGNGGIRDYVIFALTVRIR